MPAACYARRRRRRRRRREVYFQPSKCKLYRGTGVRILVII